MPPVKRTALHSSFLTSTSHLLILSSTIWGRLLTSAPSPVFRASTPYVQSNTKHNQCLKQLFQTACYASAVGAHLEGCRQHRIEKNFRDLEAVTSNLHKTAWRIPHVSISVITLEDARLECPRREKAPGFLAHQATHKRHLGCFAFALRRKRPLAPCRCFL